MEESLQFSTRLYYEYFETWSILFFSTKNCFPATIGDSCEKNITCPENAICERRDTCGDTVICYCKHGHVSSEKKEKCLASKAKY